jgi:hypothetical protein
MMTDLQIFGLVAPFGLVALAWLGVWLIRRYA